jgi:hypothetical protein
MLSYIVLSGLMGIFTPQIGTYITNTLNHAWGTHISGWAIWGIGVIIALILD